MNEKLQPCPKCGAPVFIGTQEMLVFGTIKDPVSCSNQACRMSEIWLTRKEWASRIPEDSQLKSAPLRLVVQKPSRA
jgi:hypothetical protein